MAKKAKKTTAYSRLSKAASALKAGRGSVKSVLTAAKGYAKSSCKLKVTKGSKKKQVSAVGKKRKASARKRK